MKLSETLGKIDPDRDKAVVRKKTSLSMVAPFSIGIEFELENLKDNFNKQMLLGDYWQEVGDGSLRGDGREFITKMPVKEDEVIVALENIYNAAKGTMEPLSSLRTSAHVHVNVLDMDTEEVLLFLAAGALTEEYILSLNDEYRKFCGYCNDSTAAVANVIAGTFKSKNFRVDLNSRYFGVNPMSINKHGTVEFRHFSVPHKLEDAVKNINICLQLKKLALEIGTTLKTPLTRKNLGEVLEQLKTDLEATFATNMIKSPELLLDAVDLELVRDERWSTPQARGAVPTIEVDTTPVTDDPVELFAEVPPPQTMRGFDEFLRNRATGREPGLRIRETVNTDMFEGNAFDVFRAGRVARERDPWEAPATMPLQERILRTPLPNQATWGMALVGTIGTATLVLELTKGTLGTSLVLKVAATEQLLRTAYLANPQNDNATTLRAMDLIVQEYIRDATGGDF